jgi:hypothetical protein
MAHHFRAPICTEPRDRVYAMLNLMGQTQKHLHVDYNATLPEFFVDTLCFMNKFESLPAYDVIGASIVLKEALNLYQGFVSREMQAQLDRKEAVNDMLVHIFVRGIAVRKIPPGVAEDVEDCRQLIPGLYAITPTSLFYDNSSMEISEKMSLGFWQVTKRSYRYIRDRFLLPSRITAARSFGGSAHFVSSKELCSFICKAKDPHDATAESQDEVIGLASCRVKDDDQIWQFHDTEIAFIVRHDPNTPSYCRSVIVGRAYLITQRIPFELDQFPNEPESRKGLESRNIELNSASFLDLVFWASPRTAE